MKTKVVLEIANNHQGDLAHLELIVSSIERLIRNTPVIHLEDFDFVFKFQFRDLDSFISPFVDPAENQHIARFLSTRFTSSEWLEALDIIRSRNIFSVQVTPFDERSVESCVQNGINDFKIASCSARDWSLLERVADVAKQVTFSTGGLALGEVDNLYSYFTHRGIEHLSILHCCGIYPAPLESINLATIPSFIRRYPGATIGYSGHEDPSNHLVSAMAISAGGLIVERHVGIEDTSKEIKLNKYSLNPEQVQAWIETLATAKKIAGKPKQNDYSNAVEEKSLRSLQRGVILLREANPGDSIELDDVRFAFPPAPGQLLVEDIASIYNRVVATSSIKANSPLFLSDVNVGSDRTLSVLHNYIHKVRGILNYAGYQYLPLDTPLEISHHYGIEKLDQFGCCLVNIVNRSYCKKLIVVVDGQCHPEQKHEIKEEYFLVISGTLELILDKCTHILKPGDSILVPQNSTHSFRGLEDTVFEEISTTSVPSDSYYLDKRIQSAPRDQRKTLTTLHF